MMNTNHLDEIQELNLAYLLLAQRLLNDDRAAAMFRLKIDDETADLLVSLGAAQLTRLARTNQLLCHFGFDGAEQLRQVIDNPRDNGLSQFHASLLMAGRGTASLSRGV
ncbi:flagellar transcriptional regulator FlhD [Halomonas sp. MCCC 1A17488]|uniref:Flagellar transcriptional regulator FlhD n=1 Tax=Billgrantia sulfidoxydans TaxID=2733484 RepID=A0ABX7W6I0_9GAMM|nr:MULTISPECIES: flagellar transcriptional regulator FlhD [Halomonas]MCE8014859.1 flagellar transcriptional regulator FlhD [Halomonas sp. MCCC 1A17488]MCG3238192.1 flagellar transcriptional regulator FlhD [Halomonas sp. MCCC 1A17488]QPP48042.1 flagellar transcriptional regulator FlhD [Halomonas sp. SS10-MC5]QTP55350.1 flagellar transcriptional regulator FlhD [Halomonas sulfidoxydans]